jgi:hypothetical protein
MQVGSMYWKHKHLERTFNERLQIPLSTYSTSDKICQKAIKR